MSSVSQNPTEYGVRQSNGDVTYPTTVRADAAVIAGTYPDRTLVERTSSDSEWTESPHQAPCRWPSSPICACGGAS